MEGVREVRTVRVGHSGTGVSKSEELKGTKIRNLKRGINKLIHYFPQLNFVLPCTANFRLDFCLPPAVTDTCPDFSPPAGLAEPSGVLPFMLNGNRGAFHDNWKLWDANFMTSYPPNLINWIVVKNVRLLEFAYRVRPIMENQGAILQNYILGESFSDKC
jgi:hypothetical protein